MKQINTLLLIVIAGAIAANFFYVHYRLAALGSRIDSLRLLPGTGKHSTTEQGPFDKMPGNPMDDSQRPPVGGKTSISFLSTSFDFGRQPAGPTYSTSFKFVNTGTEALFVSNAEASCGCTVPDWPRQAIKPGDTAQILVQFKSLGRLGEQEKQVVVSTNTEPGKNVLHFKCFLYNKNN